MDKNAMLALAKELAKNLKTEADFVQAAMLGMAPPPSVCSVMTVNSSCKRPETEKALSSRNW